MSENAFIRIRQLAAGYGQTPVISGLDLSIGKGEFVALLGSSGCGKTTLLRSVAGFVTPLSGSISVAGRDVTRLPPDRRGMALVFQSYALWPHMTVAQNIGYGLKLKGWSRAQIAARVMELEELLGLSGLGQRKPAALSGGQRQRVALGRALAIDPEILLLDEPLSNLDARIRLKVRHDLRALQQKLGITAIHVTHDREEAMVMADRIVIMNAGVIAQLGTPEEVYNRPASSFVAAFMGAENVLELEGTVTGNSVSIESGPSNAAANLPLDDRALVSGVMEARFRSEAAEIVLDDGDGKALSNWLELTGTIAAVTYPGGVWRHTVHVAGNELLVDATRPFEQGASVRVRIPTEKLFLFNKQDASARPHIGSSHDGQKSRVAETSDA